MASFLADRAERFIVENSDRPFVLYVSTFEPHSPYDGPFDAQYDPDEIPTGPAFLKRPEGAALVNKVRADYFMQYLHGGSIAKDDYMSNTLAPGHGPLHRGRLAQAEGPVLRQRNPRRPDGRADQRCAGAGRSRRQHGGRLHYGARRHAGATTECWRSGRSTRSRRGCRCSCASPGCRPPLAGWMAA